MSSFSTCQKAKILYVLYAYKGKIKLFFSSNYFFIESDYFDNLTSWEINENSEFVFSENIWQAGPISYHYDVIEKLLQRLHRFYVQRWQFRLEPAFRSGTITVPIALCIKY